MSITFMLIFAILFLPVGTAECEDNPQKRRAPNIVIILVDDMGYGDLSCYGNKALKTPNIDRLARRGVKFTQFYVNAPICSPARVGITT
ncbi:MAG: sulfatase-like hydrolase/transferase, partial [Pirellulales bacterium]|nr:sulfatase-like hydrolase/transferase [Pirellulales bacterium]